MKGSFDLDVRLTAFYEGDAVKLSSSDNAGGD
jgi:hypothetical protein